MLVKLCVGVTTQRGGGQDNQDFTRDIPAYLPKECGGKRLPVGSGSTHVFPLFLRLLVPLKNLGKDAEIEIT